MNEHLQENEFHCRIPTSESLVKSKPKSVKMKLAEVEHSFDPQHGLDDDGATITIPESIRKDLKNQKLHLAVKESSFGMFEKDAFKIEIDLKELYKSNQMVKTCKYAKVEF